MAAVYEVSNAQRQISSEARTELLGAGCVKDFKHHLPALSVLLDQSYYLTHLAILSLRPHRSASGRSPRS